MARLLIQHGIADLEKLFSFANGDVQTLKELAEELKHRHTSRAGALLAKVERALQGAKPTSNAPETPQPVAKPTTTPPSQQGALWDDEPKRVPKTFVVPLTAKAAEPPQTLVPVKPPVKPLVPTGSASNSKEDAPPLSVEEAYKVLKATPGATWEAIEQTRRQLVQYAHPAKVAGLSPERRAQVQADAKRANAAYAVLLQTRTRECPG